MATAGAGRAAGAASEAGAAAGEAASTGRIAATATNSARWTNAESKLANAAEGKASTNTSFLVDESGQTFPVPEGATGPNPSFNPAGNQTGVQYTGGRGGANGQVRTMRVMDAVPAKGKAPGYPKGYIKYENGASPKPQGVDPTSGKTLPSSQSHYPLN